MHSSCTLVYNLGLKSIVPLVRVTGLFLLMTAVVLIVFCGSEVHVDTGKMLDSSFVDED